MSLDTEHKMARCAREILDLLDGPADDARAGVQMPFSVAVDINSKLNAIVAMADDVQKMRKDERHELLDVIEGLLANWPTTESVGHYISKGTHAVLMKDEALTRAGRLMRELT